MSGADEQSGELVCPHCGVVLEVALREAPVEVDCPACRQQVLVPAEAPELAAEEDDLDGLRIRQAYQLRRSLYRTRRYWLVGMGIAVVAAGQILWKVFTSPPGSMGMGRAQAIVLAAIFLVGGLYCAQRARRLGQAARRSALIEPDRPPDLSALSDGTQHWKNLEAMGRDEPGSPSA